MIDAIKAQSSHLDIKVKPGGKEARQYSDPYNYITKKGTKTKHHISRYIGFPCDKVL